MRLPSSFYFAHAQSERQRVLRLYQLLGAEEVRKLKEAVDNFNTVLGNIYNELPGPSRLALSGSGRKGGSSLMHLYRQ